MSHQCEGITKKGTRCKLVTEDGSVMCRLHKDQVIRNANQPQATSGYDEAYRILAVADHPTALVGHAIVRICKDPPRGVSQDDAWICGARALIRLADISPKSVRLIDASKFILEAMYAKGTDSVVQRTLEGVREAEGCTGARQSMCLKSAAYRLLDLCNEETADVFSSMTADLVVELEHAHTEKEALDLGIMMSACCMLEGQPPQLALPMFILEDCNDAPGVAPVVSMMNELSGDNYSPPARATSGCAWLFMVLVASGWIATNISSQL